MKISVIVITYNEESNIKDCLESVIWADEIVVVDSYSSDNTLAIAREYTDKIWQHSFKGYGYQKALALSKAKGDWILSIDADERVTPKLKEEIGQAIKNDKFDGFYIPRQNFFGQRWIKHCGWYPDYQLRLFRKDKSHFDTRLVHEKVVVNGRLGYLKSPLVHYTYRSLDDFLQKMNRYVNLWAQEQLKRGRKGGILKGMFHGLWTFFKMYCLQMGFLEGRFGLLLSGLYANYAFIKYARLSELHRMMRDFPMEDQRQ